MEKDQEISIEGQSLYLSQLTYMTDQIRLSTSHAENHPSENFVFSVESKKDALKDETNDRSGAYNMNVQDQSALTLPMMAIREV